VTRIALSHKTMSNITAPVANDVVDNYVLIEKLGEGGSLWLNELPQGDAFPSMRFCLSCDKPHPPCTTRTRKEWFTETSNLAT
jgi:hypothetical protein